MQPQIPDNAKEFGLKQSEASMLQAFQQLNNNYISLLLSFVANERLAQPVTQDTRFHVEGNKLFIWEEPAAEQPSVAMPGDTPTSEAMKGGK